MSRMDRCGIGLEHRDLRALLTQTKLKPKEITTMKITYVVFKNEKGNLRVADKKEWNRIMEENCRLPREKCGFSIMNRIDLGNELDNMYIETTREAYDLWHAEN